MFKVSKSEWLKGEIVLSASKNASLPILAANFLVDNKILLSNLPNIIDINILKEIWETYLPNWTLIWDLTEKIRSSILLIPIALFKFWKVDFSDCGGCSLWKRPLNTFDNALEQAWVEVLQKSNKKTFRVKKKPNKRIILESFSVTATEALITYLAFLDKIDYEIEISNIAIEPHVVDLIHFLEVLWAKIKLSYDHRLYIKPSKINIKKYKYEIISDYIEWGTFFGLGGIVDNSEITIKNVKSRHLESVLNIANKIWIKYKQTSDSITVNSFNKKNYKSVNIQTMIFPWFPTDLQSIFGTLLTQVNGISRIHEVLFEGRFGYFTELENMWANIEILNPHEVLIIWWNKFTWTYVNTKDLRAGAWLILAGAVAEWTTHISNEQIIKRWYENIVPKLQKIWVQIEEV